MESFGPIDTLKASNTNKLKNETLKSKDFAKLDQNDDAVSAQKATEKKRKKQHKHSLMGRVGMVMSQMQSSVSRSRREPAIQPISEKSSNS